MITAICCWLPLGIGYTVWFVKNKVKLSDVLGGVIILAALTILLVNMPEKVLKSEDSPYVFDNAGWYETWVDENGNITEDTDF